MTHLCSQTYPQDTTKPSHVMANEVQKTKKPATNNRKRASLLFTRIFDSRFLLCDNLNNYSHVGVCRL